MASKALARCPPHPRRLREILLVGGASAGKRACPPEDCSGPWGYEDTLKALRSRTGWRYQQARELCSTKFDPEAFDRNAVNTALAALATTC